MTQLELVAEPEPHAAKSPLRWVGSKAWLAPTLAPLLRAHLARTHGTYREPFLGGASVALALAWPKSVLSDACRPLMETFRAIQRNAVKVHEELEAFAVYYPPSEESFYRVRDLYNGRGDRQSTDAAMFLYLMTYCYNGVYRVNGTGGFNVPWCKNADRKRPDLETLVAAQVALRGAALLQGQDFEGVIRHAEAGDVVFVDSPYVTTFDGYTQDGFALADHERLARRLEQIHKKGVAVIATNSDVPLVRDLYKWADIELTNEPVKIRPHGTRARSACVLIRAGI